MAILLLIFCAGVIWDALVTVDVMATIAKRPMVVAVTTFALTFLSCTVYNQVFVIEGWQLDRVLALAFGSSVGTAAVILISKRKKQ
jgi:hypothetical protein